VNLVNNANANSATLNAPGVTGLLGFIARRRKPGNTKS
jgi:hypothetical protein